MWSWAATQEPRAVTQMGRDPPACPQQGLVAQPMLAARLGTKSPRADVKSSGKEVPKTSREAMLPARPTVHPTLRRRVHCRAGLIQRQVCAWVGRHLRQAQRELCSDNRPAILEVANK